MDKAMRIVSVFRFLSIATITTISLCNGNLGVPCKQNKRQALLMFKQDLKDHSNRLLSWVGGGRLLQLDWTGHVRELHLGNYYSDEYLNYSLYQESSLGGKVNTSLLNLKHLSYMDLSNNDFGGIQIPSFLGSLKSLRYLNLSDSKFAGIIPHQLGNLSSLRSLGLRRKSYYVVDEGWESPMAFWSFELAEPGHECVDLSKASDWFQVTNTLPSMLVELHMSGCELNQIPVGVGVADMTRLKVVNLRWNIIWGTVPQWLYTCSNLESLSLYLNLLRGEISSSIGNLTAIVNLDLSANQIEGKMRNLLGNLCKLTVLDLSRNYFNGSVSEILGSLSRCSSGQMESPKLSTNDFSGPLSDQLGNLRHLRLLALLSNSISGPIPMSLRNLSFLEEASISENHFNGTLPKTTGQLKMVRVAYVKSTAGGL
ncbi:receptor-like protein kinase 5 [Prunus avium]|uniref:Receptor-like protein kinase 5 n=1 Tax=Prunus avium TaxID=42229 RepID=A0A6P5SHK3_PRUAV|nr:receptor-like protein kinase 5 [Prunus avium]